MHHQCLHTSCSIAPSITSLACTRVILALRGVLLHPGTESPPPYASGTLPPYHDPSDGRKGHLGGSRRRGHQNLSLDFFVSEPGEATGQSTSAGAYEFTTFGDTTTGMEVGSSAGFTASVAPSAQSASASNHDWQHMGLESGHHTPSTTSFPMRVFKESSRRAVETINDHP